jgi:type IV secretory pathway TrbD component
VGCAAGNRPALLEAAERARHAALVLGVLAFVARMACYEWLPVGSGYQGWNMVAQALRGLAAWGLVVAAIGLGRRHLTQTGWPLGIASDLSFPLYVLHFAPLTAVTYGLLGSGLGVWTRWSLSVALSWITVAMCTVLFRYLPPLRRLFGIRAPRGPAAVSETTM